MKTLETNNDPVLQKAAEEITAFVERFETTESSEEWENLLTAAVKFLLAHEDQFKPFLKALAGSGIEEPKREAIVEVLNAALEVQTLATQFNMRLNKLPAFHQEAVLERFK